MATNREWKCDGTKFEIGSIPRRIGKTGKAAMHQKLPQCHGSHTYFLAKKEGRQLNYPVRMDERIDTSAIKRNSSLLAFSNDGGSGIMTAVAHSHVEIADLFRRLHKPVILFAIAILSFFIPVAALRAQLGGMNDLIWSAPPSVAPVPLLPEEAPMGMGITTYSLQRPSTPMNAPAAAGGLGGFFLVANAAGRAAVIEDSTRVATPQNGGFLPSGIPTQGGQFFGGPSRALVSASGSVLNINAGSNESGAIANTRLTTVSPGGASDPSSGSTAVALQTASVQVGRIFVGIGETAMADDSALPTIMDLSGPGARVTAYSGGSSTGTGRLSATWLAPSDNGPAPGLTSIASVESPVPEIQSSATPGLITKKNTSAFSNFPDIISTTYYSDGYNNGKYNETFHLQSSTVFRSLGIENDAESLRSRAFGWGESISGGYMVNFTSNTDKPDAIVASYTIGQGIAHYIVDLQTSTMALKSGGSDAVLNSANALVALPVSAWYCGYIHNWTDALMSNFTYSQTTLGSFVSHSSISPTTVSPYHRGEYVQANLQYTRPYTTDGKVTHVLHSGVEYIYGDRQNLDGTAGHASRVLFVVAIQK